MLKVRTIGAFALAGMLTAGGLMSATTVHAAGPTEGSTPVTYDNRKILPDSSARYGVIIPTAISFSDTNKTANADVEILGINGFTLSDWSSLQVTTSVKSKNSYKMKNGKKEVPYTLKYEGNDANMTADDSAQAITKKLGKGTAGEVAKVTGTATIGDRSKASKGQYTDTLTYSFVEGTNTLSEGREIVIRPEVERPGSVTW